VAGSHGLHREDAVCGNGVTVHEEECCMTYSPLRGCITTKVLGVVWSFAWPGGDSYIVALGFPGEDHVWFEDRWMVASWCDE
jgi:hypothetical protein